MENKAPGADCANCPFKNNPFVPTFIPEVGGRIPLVMVGDKPERPDAKKGKPFTGTAGRLLNKMIERAGIPPEDVALIDTVSCVARGGPKFFGQAQQCCSGRFFRELEEINAGKIALLGKGAQDMVLPHLKDAPITKMRGQLFYNEESDQQLMPTWHPRYILSRNSEAPTLYNDLKWLWNAVGDGIDDRFRDEPEVTTPQSVEEAIMLLHSIPAGPVAVDIESSGIEWYPRGTNDFDPDKLIMVAIAWQYEYGITIPATLIDEEYEVWEALDEFFKRTDITFIAHNGKFDTAFLDAHFDLWLRVDFDTMLAHHILDEEPPHGLKALAQNEFNIPDYEERIIAEYLKNRNDDYRKIPYDKFALYAVWDVCVTLGLYELYKEQLLDEALYQWPFMNVVMRAHKLLVSTELYGFYVDKEYLIREGAAMLQKMDELQDIMGDLVGFPVNPRSFKQVGEALYDVLGYRLPANKVGHGRNKVKPRATSKDAVKYLLERYGKTDFLKALKEYRRIAKLYGSYVKNLLQRVSPINRVHATFNIHGTNTGRLSVRDPGLQTIPREDDKYGRIIRGSFGAKPGYMLVDVDYGQAELVTAGALSGSPFLKMVYDEQRDLHDEVMNRLYTDPIPVDMTDDEKKGEKKKRRNVAKMANFSQLYGKDPNALRADDRMNISMKDAMEILEKYNAMMPVLSAWKLEQGIRAAHRGYSQSIFGRKRRYKVVSSQTQNDINKAAINQPIQGASSDLTLLSACNLQDELNKRGMDAHVVLLVHDSIIIEAHESIADEVLRMAGELMVRLAYSTFPVIAWKADGEIKKHWSPRDEDPKFQARIFRMSSEGEYLTWVDTDDA